MMNYRARLLHSRCWLWMWVRQEPSLALSLRRPLCPTPLLQSAVLSGTCLAWPRSQVVLGASVLLCGFLKWERSPDRSFFIVCALLHFISTQILSQWVNHTEDLKGTVALPVLWVDLFAHKWYRRSAHLFTFSNFQISMERPFTSFIG